MMNLELSWLTGNTLAGQTSIPGLMLSVAGPNLLYQMDNTHNLYGLNLLQHSSHTEPLVLRYTLM